MKRSEAIANFLKRNTHADLSILYNSDMEVQLNVAKGTGEKNETGNLDGNSWVEWTDGIEKWKTFRMPRKAMTIPESNDYNITFDIDKHTEGIGMTGWDWNKKLSRWVTFDFDAMLGHSDKHTNKLTDKELSELQQVVKTLPFVTLRKSTSGKGLHLYIFLEPIETSNHTEHAALARSILSMIAGQTGFNFTDKVDICGGNMWVWHRKMKGTDGLALIKEGKILSKDLIPVNWRDHLSIVTRKALKVTNAHLNLPKYEMDLFDELTSQRSKVPLDEDHLKLINWLADRRYQHWWNTDAHTLVTHTSYLKDAHAALGIKGEFYTDATGKDSHVGDINCFLFPLRNGAWSVKRYGGETKEHKYWKQDAKKYTSCYYNRDLVLEEVARLYDAVELENKGYQFESCKQGIEAMSKLGIVIELPNQMETRVFKVKESVEGRYVAAIPKLENEDSTAMKGWAIEKGIYKKVFNNPKRGVEGDNDVFAEYDEVIRHVVSEHGEDLGWMISTSPNNWREEPTAHIRLLLKSKGIGGKDIDLILGQAVARAWTVVNQPFKDEYPGDRQWNRSQARFKIPPTIEGEQLSHPTWDRILKHCGQSLNDAIKANQWCVENGISTGADYLKLWFACLVKHPGSPLPYLGLFGPQNSGKSTLHEAFCQLLLSGGYTRADAALISGSGFNGELEGAVLAIIEETDLSIKGSNKTANQRMKDWVTSAQISIHAKGKTPYMVTNYTHWIQCANDRNYIPVFQGDTRVTLIYVDTLPQDQLIPKRDLWIALTKETPDFLATLLMLEIPDSRDRLMLPVINTQEKADAEYDTMNAVERFLKDKVYEIPGSYVSASDLFDAFSATLDTIEKMNWSSNKFGREMPKRMTKGRIASSKTQDTYYANISLNPDDKPGKPWVKRGSHFLVQES